ncbi:MAG: pirin family protein [Planctomycetes bacterium]|nr:pirin family protein [Planctomycetota bacterium]
MTDPVLSTSPLGAPPWATDDPFLFCVHHKDAYPAGTPALGVAPELLRGRQLGMDFSGRDGWSMYHGDAVPGFPQHPHRGFETLTVARSGFIDHFDSLGATARFGAGDAQWMTAGAGIVHSEMFPLLEQDADNPAELFQIWLNLPARDKLVAPYFTMLWSEDLPTLREEGAELTVVAGGLCGAEPPAPPPNSWAADPAHEVVVATVRLAPGGRWTLPPAKAGVGRSLYAFAGQGLKVAGRPASGQRLRLRAELPALLEAGSEPAELLLLQGRPIGEPVAQHGPFVMNTRAELATAFRDFQETGFGGWPWPSDAPVHPRGRGRFAVHAEGATEER